MGRSTANTLFIAGAIFALLGVAGLMVPVFSVSHTEDVATIGDLKIQANEKTPYSVPLPVSGAALILGIVLIGRGFYVRN